jgi:hypothetical protein
MQIMHPMFPYYNIPPSQKQEEVQKKCNMMTIILQKDPSNFLSITEIAGADMQFR